MTDIWDLAAPDIPVDYQRLNAEVFGLIDTGIWEPISRDTFKRWISQFRTNDEKLLGSLIARHLIFRSAKQKKAVLRQAIERGVTNVTAQHGREKPSLRESLFDGQADTNGIFFAPVEWLGMPPGKSGQPLIRDLKRNFRLRNDCLIYGAEFRNKKLQDADACLVFIDDTLGSGHQFEDCLTYNNLLDDNILDSIIYIPLMAHEDGVAFLHHRYPQVRIWPGELLTKKHNAFQMMDQWARDPKLRFSDHPEKIYRSICKRHAPFDKSGNGIKGYDEMSLLLGYDNATPDNSLPLLWDRARTWRPLLIR